MYGLCTSQNPTLFAIVFQYAHAFAIYVQRINHMLVKVPWQLEASSIANDIHYNNSTIGVP